MDEYSKLLTSISNRREQAFCNCEPDILDLTGEDLNTIERALFIAIEPDDKTAIPLQERNEL